MGTHPHRTHPVYAYLFGRQLNDTVYVLPYGTSDPRNSGFPGVIPGKLRRIVQHRFETSKRLVFPLDNFFVFPLCLLHNPGSTAVPCMSHGP